jgi:integrase
MPTIRKRNSRWQAQVRRLGFPSVSKSFLLRKDALEWAREMERQVDRKELSPDLKILDTISLGQLIERYKIQIVSRKKSARNETIALDAFLRQKMCKKLLSQISPADFSQYRDMRLKSITAKSLKREFSPIHNMFEVARDEWNLPLKTNPLEKIKIQAIDVKRERRLEDGEYEKLLSAAKTRQNPYIPIVIIFATETAMRRGEILNLSWRQVDLKRRCVTILESKNGYSRTIPLTPKAYALLHDLDKDHDQVFPLTANALKMAWGRILKLANIEDLHFHDLRHEAVSRFFEMGLTVPEVASISGHRDVRMLLRYAHANTSTLQAKLECKS